jgi:hypothetical protein
MDPVYPHTGGSQHILSSIRMPLDVRTVLRSDHESRIAVGQHYYVCTDRMVLRVVLGACIVCRQSAALSGGCKSLAVQHT